jgi:hypothetical protein
MAVTNANAGAVIGNVSVSSLTLSAFNASGSDFIFLGVSQWSTTDRTPSAQFNGAQNFTVHAQQTLADGGGTRRVTILKLVAPTQTTANIVVSWSGTVDEAVIGATAWLGVDPSTPLGTAVINTVDGAFELSVDVTAAVGSVTHDCYSGSADSGLGSTTNQTQRWHDWAAVFTTEGGGASAAGTGGAVTHTWSNVGQGGFIGNVRIVLIGVPILAAAAGGSIVPIAMAQYRQRHA